MNRLDDYAFIADTGSSRGRGVFASKNIAVGEIFCISFESWQLLAVDAVRALPKWCFKLCSEFEHDPKFLVCPSDFNAPPMSHIINHSCDPNMASTDNYESVLALRDISSGEELTFDYVTFNTGTDEFDCKCGAIRCRGRFTRNDWKIPELQEKYRSYFQTNILSKIDASRRGKYRIPLPFSSRVK